MYRETHRCGTVVVHSINPSLCLWVWSVLRSLIIGQAVGHLTLTSLPKQSYTPKAGWVEVRSPEKLPRNFSLASAL